MKSRLLALLCVIISLPAYAVEIPGLFTAEVPFDRSERDAQALAYDAALAVVLLRVSGSELLNDTELYEALFPNPERYVIRFRQGSADTLFVSFDGEALTKALRDAGQTVWGDDRPLTLIWLAVDYGQGDRQIVAATDDLDPDPMTLPLDPDAPEAIDRNRMMRERILDIANGRGLPVLFPMMDSEDLARVSSADIWGGFDEQILAASERYGVESVLIGRVPAGQFERERWHYYFGPEQRVWAGEPEFVISQVADFLAGEFAIRGDAPVRTVSVNISGIFTVDAYGGVQTLLDGISVVDGYRITEVDGDTLRLEVNAVGGAERLARALRLAGLLEEERIDSTLGDSGFLPSVLDFYYNP